MGKGGVRQWFQKSFRSRKHSMATIRRNDLWNFGSLKNALIRVMPWLPMKASQCLEAPPKTAACSSALRAAPVSAIAFASSADIELPKPTEGMTEIAAKAPKENKKKLLLVKEKVKASRMDLATRRFDELHHPLRIRDGVLGRSLYYKRLCPKD